MQNNFSSFWPSFTSKTKKLRTVSNGLIADICRMHYGFGFDRPARRDARRFVSSNQDRVIYRITFSLTESIAAEGLNVAGFMVRQNNAFLTVSNYPNCVMAS